MCIHYCNIVFVENTIFIIIQSDDPLNQLIPHLFLHPICEMQSTVIHEFYAHWARLPVLADCFLQKTKAGAIKVGIVGHRKAVDKITLTKFINAVLK